MSAPIISPVRLVGHKGPISCLRSNKHGILISGSDDRTVRVWDLNVLKTIKCIAGCFDGAIEAIQFGSNSQTLFAATEHSVFSFDLQCDGIIIRQPLAQIKMDDCGDSINTIALNSRHDNLAVAMDSGVINLIPIKLSGEFHENIGNTRYKKLSRTHTNIVNTVMFRKTNPRELLSGGFDYVGCLWDIDRARPKVSTTFKQLGSIDGSTLQIVNPPFVMNMTYICDSRYVVAALGDGTIRILNVKDFSINTIIEAHNCMITAMYTDDNYIISGGVDSIVNIYQVTEGASNTGNVTEVIDAHAVEDESKTTESCLDAIVSAASSYDRKQPVSNKSKKDKKRNAHSKVGGGGLASSSVELSISRLCKIEHTAKINSIEFVYCNNSSSESQQQNSTSRLLCVADVTNDITLYSLCC